MYPCKEKMKDIILSLVQGLVCGVCVCEHVCMLVTGLLKVSHGS